MDHEKSKFLWCNDNLFYHFNYDITKSNSYNFSPKIFDQPDTHQGDYI